jgi:flagellar basal body rod protein FlgC
MVRMPDIDMGDQMTQLIIAQRAYQVNISSSSAPATPTPPR